MSSLCYKYPWYPRPKQTAVTQTCFLRRGYIASQTLHKLKMSKTVQNLWRGNVCRAIYWKTKLDVSCKGWKKTEKNGVPLSIPLWSCTSSYVELLVFLRTLVIPDNVYLKVSSFYPSSLQRICALEEFSIPSRKKTKPKFSGLFHLRFELQSSRAQEAFLCKPIYWQWSEVYSGIKNTSYWYKDKRNYCNSDRYLCSPQNILIGLTVVVVSPNPTTFRWPSR